MNSRVGTAASTALPIAVAVLLAVATFRPPLPAPIGLDVDSSWRLALHRVDDWNLTWGRDVAFTYGPLGRWLQPIPETSSALATLGLFAVAHLAVALFAWGRFRAGSLPATDAVAAAALLLTAHALGMEPDGLLLVALVACAMASLHGTGLTATLWCAGTGLAAGLLPFAKFSFAFSALGAGVVLWWNLRHREGAVHLRWALIVSSCVGFVIGASALGWRELGSWLLRSWQIAGGFGAAMSTPTRWTALATAMLLIVAVVVAAVRGPALRADMALCALPLAVELKHAMVRSWFRAPLFFAVALAFATLLLTVPGTASARRIARALAACTLVAGVAVFLLFERNPLAAMRTVSPRTAVEAVRWILPSARDAALATTARTSTENLARLRLPETERVRLAAPGRRVAVLPWRLAICEANALDCVPPRTLQLYSAYSPALDLWVRSGFEQKPPDFVLLHVPEAQRRLYFASAPATWAAIEAGYQPEGRFDDAGILVLRRRAEPSLPRPVERVAQDESSAALVLPDDAATPTARIDLELSGLARPLSWLAWVPPVELELLLRDGRVLRRRIVPSLASSGLRLATIESVGDLERYFLGLPAPREAAVESLRLVGPGLQAYRKGPMRVERFAPAPRRPEGHS